MTSAYANPPEGSECDVIMKGGITSGIVYPKAILRLAEKRRFRSIGGTSAGAIAAAITAAAELGRDKGGFEAIAGIPEEMSKKLATLFQPVRAGRVLYSLFYDGFLGDRWTGPVTAAIASEWPAVLAGASIGVAIALLGWAGGGGFAAVVPGLLLALVLAALFAAVSFVRTTFRLLPEMNFGLCTGRTQPGQSEKGLSDWLADTIEHAAGRPNSGHNRRPLTFGDLWKGANLDGSREKAAIDLRMMTTNLSMKRPHVLPDLGDLNYYFRRSDFAAIFPDWVVETITPPSGLVSKLGDDFYRFPAPADLPVVVATRMSLSFPILFAAVPLYREDFAGGAEKPGLERLLFSDGGISSNFPVHFFDALLPRRPTFGISLDDLDPGRPERRVRLPMAAGAGQWIAISPIETLTDFVWSIVYAAKDWQDQLQSVLSGYRERIVHVGLDATEGGLNLAMPPERIVDLVGYGERAGALLAGAPLQPEVDRDVFEFDDHRWRRFLVAFARMEESLSRAAEVWKTRGYRELIQSCIAEPPSYKGSSQPWRRDVFERFSSLMDLAEPWIANPLGSHPDASIPKPATDLRITPRP